MLTQDPKQVLTAIPCLFATDGTLAKTEHTKETIASDTDAATVFDKYIKKFVADDELVNLYYDKYAQRLQH